MFHGTDRFEVRRQIGAGGMGVVYEAFDHDNKTRVALKTLRHVDARSLYMFKNEFRALQDLDHPNLVRLGELIERDGRWFFTMELVVGVDLLSYVCRQKNPDQAKRQMSATSIGPATVAGETQATALMSDASRSVQQRLMTRYRGFDESKLRGTLLQLADALATIHEAGKIHRDVKPSNILVTKEGRVVLMDFGLIVGARDRVAAFDCTTAGTIAYMAPEQSVGDELTPAADCYSVGVLLYVALTGRLPYWGRAKAVTDRKHMAPPTPAKYHNPEVPDDLDRLCSELLEPAANLRPTARQVQVRLSPPGAAQAAGNACGIKQSTPFVGRTKELAALHQALRASRRHPVVVLIEGSSGLGKTALVEQFAKEIGETVADSVVLRGRCYERESVSYKAFDGIADALSRHLLQMARPELVLPVNAGLLPRLFPVLQRVEPVAGAPLPPAILDVQEQRSRLVHVFRQLLCNLARESPLVLTIDDLQWTDRDSLTLLCDTMSHEDAPAALVVATTRPVSARVRKPVDDVLEQLADVRRLRLSALPADAARSLAEQLLPAGARVNLEAIAAEAGGHPLFIQELVRYAEHRPNVSGLTLDRALSSRIERIDRRLRRLLQVVGIAGSPISQNVAARAAQMDGDESARAVATLRAARLVRTDGAMGSDIIATYHDRVREVLLHHMDRSQRPEGHRRLESALEADGSALRDPHALVRHAEAAGDRERAARYAESAADRAMASMAFEQGARFFATALKQGVLSRERERDLRLKLAAALVHCGRGAQAAEAFVGAADPSDLSQWLDCMRQASEQWLITGHLHRGMQALDELLIRAGESLAKTPKRAMASLLWNRLRLRRRGLHWEARQPKDIAYHELIRVDVLKSVTSGLGMLDNVRASAFSARLLHAALDAGETKRVVFALAIEGLFLSGQGGGGSRRGRAIIERVKTLVAHAPYDPQMATWAQLADGLAYCLEGEPARAAPFLHSAERLLTEELSGATFERNNVRLFRAFTLRELGRMKEATRLSAGYIRDAERRGDVYLKTSVLLTQGRFEYLCRDDLRGVESCLEQAVWQPPERGYHFQHFYELETRGEIALYRGEAESALGRLTSMFGGLQRALLLRAVVPRVRVRGLRARLLLACQPAQGLAEVERLASQIARERDNRWARVQALLLFAGHAYRAHKPADAESYLRRAIACAEAAEMQLHRASAELQLGAVLGGDEGAQLRASGSATMSHEGVVNPSRFAALYAPGFG